MVKMSYEIYKNGIIVMSVWDLPEELKDGLPKWCLDE